MLLLHRGYRAFLLAFMLVAAPLAQQARAGDGASAFIAQLGEQATATMTDRTISVAERVQRFGVIIDQDFDIPKIAEVMLGRYWQNATAADRSEFTSVFRDYMLRVYSDNFTNYSIDTFHVIDQRAAGTLTTIVRTGITRTATDEPITIEWQVMERPEGFKVYDLSVGGVSLATAQQEEFASAMQRTGGQVSILTKMMRMRLTQTETAQQ
jgi:phospholipid transport system substrate-binding protein